MSGSQAFGRFDSRSRRVAFVLGTLVAVMSAATPAHAQMEVATPAQAQKEMNEYVNSEGRTVDLTPFKAQHPTKMLQAQGPLLQAINAGKASPQEMLTIETITWIHIAELTWPSPDPKQSFEQRRNNTKQRLLMRPLGTQDNQQAPDIHDKVNGFFLKGLPMLVGDEGYSLNSRFNAIVLLGHLDKIEPDILKNRVAVPLVEATPLLLQAYQTANFPETLRIGALMGIVRHCELNLVAANRPLVADALLKLLSEKAPPAGWSVDGFHWARKLALQAVAGLGASGAGEVNKPEFVNAIHQIIADDKQPLFLRREGCQSLATLTPSTLGAPTAKPAELMKSLANFALTISRAGSPRIDPTAPIDLAKPEDVLPTPIEGPGFVPPGVPPFQAGLITPPKKLFAEAVTYYLHAISAAMGGRDQTHGLLNAGGLKPDLVEKGKALLSDHINPMIAAMNRTAAQTTAVRLTQDMNAAHAKLSQWMQGLALIAAPAAPAPGGAGGGAAPIAPAPVAPALVAPAPGGQAPVAPVPAGGATVGAP